MPRFMDTFTVIWRFCSLLYIILYTFGRWGLSVFGNDPWMVIVFIVAVLSVTIDIVMYMFGLRIFVTASRRIVANLYNGTFIKPKTHINVKGNKDNE